MTLTPVYLSSDWLQIPPPIPPTCLPGSLIFVSFTGFEFGVAGSVTCKEFVDCGNEFVVKLFDALPEGSPAEILPEGLDLKRQWYLYNEIREFCDARFENLVCPLPSAPLISGMSSFILVNLFMSPKDFVSV